MLDIIDNKNKQALKLKKQIPELINTISKPKINKNVSSEDINNLIILFRYNLKYVNIPNKLKFLRDQKIAFWLKLPLNQKLDI